MSEKNIAWILATRKHSPFHIRKHIAVVPNVSWGLLPWEADLVVLHRSSYLTEIEIKISMADWKADLGKAKHQVDAYPHAKKMIRRFFYAAPPKLAERYAEVGIPDSAGVLAIGDNKVTVLRPATALPYARKLTESEIIALLRLAALKAWRMAYDPAYDVMGFSNKLEDDETFTPPPADVVSTGKI